MRGQEKNHKGNYIERFDRKPNRGDTVKVYSVDAWGEPLYGICMGVELRQMHRVRYGGEITYLREVVLLEACDSVKCPDFYFENYKCEFV